MEFNKTEEIFLERVVLSLVKENKKPTSQNIEQAIKNILKRDKELYKQKDKVCKVIGNIVWGNIQKQEINKKVLAG
jgi:predicted dithiol-disulfide oxidoreductase (DUF899 family)